MQHKWCRVFVAHKFCVSVFSSSVCCIVWYFIGNKVNSSCILTSWYRSLCVLLARINGAGFLQAGSARQSYTCMTESTIPVVWTCDLKKLKFAIVIFWFQGLFQCHNGKTGTVWSYPGTSASWLQCPVGGWQCLLVCGLPQEELSSFGLCLLRYILRGAFLSFEGTSILQIYWITVSMSWKSMLTGV